MSQTSQIAFRVDASSQIGTGHLMRCLTLADRLRLENHDAVFICRHLPESMQKKLRDAGHAVWRLQARNDSECADDEATQHAAWLGTTQEHDAEDTRRVLAKLDNPPARIVVDHYSLSACWERAVGAATDSVVAIDDLADRTHECDVLIDPSYMRNCAQRYAGLTTASCRKLLGPRYAILRPEFQRDFAVRKNAKSTEGSLRVFVFFGGADTINQTAKVLTALQGLGDLRISADVVVGALNPHGAEIERTCASMEGINCIAHTGEIARIMAKADLALTAAGTVVWELLALGVPSLVTSVADNQRGSATALAEDGYLLYLGDAAKTAPAHYVSWIRALASNPWQRRSLSVRGADLVDGGGTARIARVLSGTRIALRDAGPQDSSVILDWRNSEENRRYALNSEIIGRDRHASWYAAALKNPARIILIGESGDESIGVVRFDLTTPRATVSIFLVPGLKGRGLGTMLLDAALGWLEKMHPEIEFVDAQVRPENVPSTRLFMNAGFARSHMALSARLPRAPSKLVRGNAEEAER